MSSHNLPVNTVETPLISIVMPVYQGESYILKAVRSILNQTYRNFELIIVDDGSTDDTLRLLASEYDARIRVVSQENQGVARARNYGISLAKGDYIAFLDADDLWLPEKLTMDVKTIQAAPDPVCLVYSWYYAVDDAERLVNLSYPYQDQGHLLTLILENEGLLLPSTTTMHREIIQAIGGFPLDSYHEDRVFFIKACREFLAFPTGQRTVIYRQTLSGRCRSVLKNFEQALEAELSIVDALKPFLSEPDINRLSTFQVRNLFYRFLMYNYVASARNLYPRLDPSLLFKDKKGVLSWLSMVCGINILYVTRMTVQWCTKYLMQPWWRTISAPAYLNRQRRV